MTDLPIDVFQDLSENIIGMPEVVEIVRRERVRVGPGEYELVWTVALETKGRLSALTASESARYGQFVQGAEASLAMPKGTLVEPEDRIRISTRGGEEWEITGIPPRSEALAADRKVFVRRFG